MNFIEGSWSPDKLKTGMFGFRVGLIWVCIFSELCGGGLGINVITVQMHDDDDLTIL